MSRRITEVYGLEEIDDELGEGLRLMSSRDTVYEARSIDGVETRIHSHPYGPGYTATVRFPEDDGEVAYDTAMDLADRVAEEYDIDLSIPFKEFHQEVQENDHIGTRQHGVDDEVTLRYNETDQTDVDCTGKGVLLGLATGWGTHVGSIGGAGAATAALAAGPEAAATGAMFGLIGLATPLMEDIYNDITGKTGPGGKVAAHFMERSKKRYHDEERLADDTLLEEVNDLNVLDRRFQETERTDGVDRYDALQENGVEEIFEDIMDVHFDDFEKRQGVTVSHTGRSYGGAVNFVTTMLGRDMLEMDRPTIFEKPELYETIYQQLDPRDRQQLVEETLSCDDYAPGIDAFVEDEADVSQIGVQTLMDDDGRSLDMDDWRHAREEEKIELLKEEAGLSDTQAEAVLRKFLDE